MKQILIVAFIFCFFSFSTYAQWGVKGGVHLSSISYNAAEYKTSFHIGGTYDFELSKKWHLQPELQLTSVGCNLKDDGIFLKGGHIRFYALELPVNFSFRPTIANNLKLLVDFGLYARLNLFGSDTYKYYYFENVADKNSFDVYNRFDTGLGLGLGLQKKQYYGVFTFQRGFIHVEKDISVYHQVFKLSLGYKF